MDTRSLALRARFGGLKIFYSHVYLCVYTSYIYCIYMYMCTCACRVRGCQHAQLSTTAHYTPQHVIIATPLSLSNSLATHHLWNYSCSSCLPPLVRLSGPSLSGSLPSGALAPPAPGVPDTEAGRKWLSCKRTWSEGKTLNNRKGSPSLDHTPSRQRPHCARSSPCA